MDRSLVTAIESGGLYGLVVAPGASANHFLLLVLRGEHVVVHRDDHGNEYDRIVEKMQFHPREDQLQNTARHWPAPEIVVRRGLRNQQEMFDVVPELDHQRHCPPGPRSPGKSLAQDPNTGEHDQSEALVQSLGFDYPAIPQTNNSICD